MNNPGINHNIKKIGECQIFFTKCLFNLNQLKGGSNLNLAAGAGLFDRINRIYIHPAPSA